MIISLDTTMVPNLTMDLLQWLAEQQYCVTVTMTSGASHKGQTALRPPKDPECEFDQAVFVLIKTGGRCVSLPLRHIHTISL